MINTKTLYNYSVDIFHNDIKNPYDKIEKLSKKRFKYILELSEAIFNISGESTFTRARKILLRPMIEAAIDIENLKNHGETFINTLDLLSFQENEQFFQRFFSLFEKFICSENKFDKSSKLQKIKTLKKSISNDMGYKTRANISDKFSDLEIRNRFKKYQLTYDILSLYTHNTDLKELKFIKNIPDDFYWDILASILKNSLINLSQIYNIEIDKKLISTLKKNIIEKNIEIDFLTYYLINL